MIIGILGSNGVVGSSLVKNLSENNKIVEITRKNYDKIKKLHLIFDVLINANGNASKRLATKNPLEDLELSVASVYDYLADFECKRYIYISSIDILYESTYGLHKQFAESIVTLNYNDYTCLRLGAVIGKKAKKGLTFDIANLKEVGVSADSRLQLVHVNDIAEIIKVLFTLGEWEAHYNCWSPDNISPDEISEALGKPIKYGNDLRKQIYNEDSRSSIYQFKTCLEALETLKEEYNGSVEGMEGA